MTDRPPLDPSRLRGLGRWRLEVVDRTASTNADVAARARAGEPDGLVLVTEHQTAGRGRLGRTWETPPYAALTFSALLVPEHVPAHRWPWLSLVTGLAVVDGVRAATGLVCGLKWPNDVMRSGRKLGGILLERVEGRTVAAAVVGVGLNVHTGREELPVPEATSLALEGLPDADRSVVLGEVLAALDARVAQWVRDPAGIRAAYLDRSVTLGALVTVAVPGGGRLDGEAVDVDRDGALVLLAGGRRTVLSAGDVGHVRERIPR